MLFRATIFVAIITGALALAGTASAAWVDDWLDQRTTTSPNYFTGQQRGYYSGGSFCARWPNTADYPVTVEMPRIKSGCGGIDVFMGGFSFMNTDYFVDKLQGILSGAASVAFDLGLKTLCEQCSNTIKNFEALSDKLNSMQLDECAAAKELVGVVMDENGFHSSEVMKEKLGTAIKENKLSQGVFEMWDIITTEDKANNNVPQSGDVSRVTSGCNAEITSTFLPGSSLLENVGSKMGLPADYTNLIRSLVGDLNLEGSANAYKVSYEAPCPENNPDDIKAFTSGEVYTKNTAVYTVYYDSVHPEGTNVTCTEAWNSLQPIYANPNNYDEAIKKVCSKAYFDPANTVELNTCQTLLTSTLNFTTGTAVTPEKIIQQRQIAEILYNFYFQDDYETSMLMESNRKITSTGLGTGLTMNEWIPIIRAVMTAI